VIYFELKKMSGVQVIVNDNIQRRRSGEQKQNAAEVCLAERFTFGRRRRGAGHARRLFVPQKRLMSPVFETKTERPGAILRMLSTSA